MSVLKELSLFSVIFTYITFGLILHFLITLIQPKSRYRLISNWTKISSVFLRKILGIKISVEGETEYLKENGNLIISNHLSYLDGVVLASLFPAVFVSKLQVRSWPVFGWLAQIGATIFIDRKRKLKSKDFVEEITGMLKKKINVFLFPEGTSTNGSKILSFQSAFFQSPLNAGSSIIPVTIQYTKINAQNINLLNRDKIFWYGQINFLKHLSDVVKLKNIEIQVIIHPKIEVNAFYNQPNQRKQLSEFSRQVILRDFSLFK